MALSHPATPKSCVGIFHAVRKRQSRAGKQDPCMGKSRSCFREQVVDQTDSEQIEVTDADAQLDTPKQEQRRFVLVY